MDELGQLLSEGDWSDPETRDKIRALISELYGPEALHYAVGRVAAELKALDPDSNSLCVVTVKGGTEDDLQRVSRTMAKVMPKFMRGRILVKNEFMQLEMATERVMNSMGWFRNVGGELLGPLMTTPEPEIAGPSAAKSAQCEKLD
jgi:hypothetical protein